MSTYKTEGIIIKRNNFLESSLILDIYTRDYGKVEAVARSARKAKGKLKGHLELFLWTELILAHGKNIDTITSSLTIESFSSLRNNLKLSFAAYYILELVDKMTAEEHQDERIFYLLKKVLLFLDGLASAKQNKAKNKVNMANSVLRSLSRYRSFGMTKRGDIHFIIQNNLSNVLILLFQINLLDLTGFSPELSKCVFCGKPIKPDKNYFSFSMGGVVGKECIQRKNQSESFNLPVSDNTIKLSRLFQFKGGDAKEYNEHLDKCFKVTRKLNADEKLVLDNIFLMNKFIEFNAERKIKGFDFLK